MIQVQRSCDHSSSLTWGWDKGNLGYETEMAPLPLDVHIMKARKKAVRQIHVATAFLTLPYVTPRHNLQPGMRGDYKLFWLILQKFM